MAVPTDTELRELKDLIATLTQRVEVGFAQMDAKLADVRTEIQRVEGKSDIKFAELSGKIDVLNERTSIKFAELSGKIDVLNERTSIGFWGFVGRALIVTVFSFLVLGAIKYGLTGKLKV
jgi:hypothetical protein